MTLELKVQINESKSLTSEVGVVEFAKRIMGPLGDYSPVGPKNVALALVDKLNLPSLFVDFMEKGNALEYFSLKRFLSSISKSKLFNFT